MKLLRRWLLVNAAVLLLVWPFYAYMSSVLLGAYPRYEALVPAFLAWVLTLFLLADEPLLRKLGKGEKVWLFPWVSLPFLFWHAVLLEGEYIAGTCMQPVWESVAKTVLCSLVVTAFLRASLRGALAARAFLPPRAGNVVAG